MNFHTYANYYSQFHGYTFSFLKENVLIFHFITFPYAVSLLSRMEPPSHVFKDSDKPFLQALKAFFKSDVPASVVMNEKNIWTICLGKDRILYSVNEEVCPKQNTIFQLYVTPYFVENPNVIQEYMQGTIRPVYENVFFYKNTVLYLDDQDLPYPGGNYYRACEKLSKPANYYRMCFLSDESIDHVLHLITEWKSRQGILFIPYLTRDVVALPKFINFQPVSEYVFSDEHISSTGVIHKKLSSRKPEHLIQDILTSYYTNVSRRQYGNVSDFNALGLYIEWPFLMTFEGARHNHDSVKNGHRKFVALSINGTRPNRVLSVCRPYERYVEYNDVPATLWTPVSFMASVFQIDLSLRKVMIDTVCLGVVYRETFFCLDQPLLEGTPTTRRIVNGEYMLSVASFDMANDTHVRIHQTFRLDERYSLCRVSLKGMPLDTWCLTKSSLMDPFPKKFRLPDLARMWVNFLTQVIDGAFDVNLTNVRLALMLSKHNICFDLNAAEKKRGIMMAYNKIDFYFHEKIVHFLNEVRILKQEEKVALAKATGSNCIIA